MLGYLKISNEQRNHCTLGIAQSKLLEHSPQISPLLWQCFCWVRVPGACREPGHCRKLQWDVFNVLQPLPVLIHGQVPPTAPWSWAKVGEAGCGHMLPAAQLLPPSSSPAQMRFRSGCNHPASALTWRSLLPPLLALHLLRPGSAQIRVVAPSPRVMANVGQDVVLRCHLSPCKDAWSLDIRWIQHRSSGLVHHYQDGFDLEQMEEYKGRTELLRNGLSDGNLDLRITAVTSSDSGSYTCAVQDGDGYAEAVVNLEVSDPFFQIVRSWAAALAVVITLLLGSSVIIAFLQRKRGELREEGMECREVLRETGMVGVVLSSCPSRRMKGDFP
ncbi:myelin-oligodendrocyte glycoprotein-like isoform X1 [Numida meleagris]|uniref:myelin-oligodendrocyte glycoprotein-like isoform X1 n=1 Tax=Numida meleagris TaxID=8996 RepID=UPI000B3D92D6|nr:myelin-oligodendrocyte glycoprotein-like isoform X1 [Numida meleagris]